MSERKVLTMDEVRPLFADPKLWLNTERARADFDAALARHDAEKRAEWEAEGRRWYAACWRDDNGTLNSLESSTVSREHAEADVKRWRAAEAKEDGGQPDRVVLASKISYPWMPVEQGKTTKTENGSER